MAVFTIIANERAELIAENRRLREEITRLRRLMAAPSQAPPAAVPLAPSPAPPAAVPLAPPPAAERSDLDAAVTRFSLLELDL